MTRSRGRVGVAASAAPRVLSELDPNIESDDDEDEDYPSTSKAAKKHFRSHVHDDDDEYLSPLVCSDSDGEHRKNSLTMDEAVTKKTKGKSPKQKQKQRQRRRRRSSARFLRLSGRFGNEGDDEDLRTDTKRNENLGEVYRQAIQMNVENKINAGNSWGLKLIENMDKFTYDDEEESPREQEKLKEAKNRSKRVNFTKASCTLDASVKIYGYRVDDVHLTSYKVLANLSRSDNNGNKKNNLSDKDGGEGSVRSSGGKKHSVRSGPTETLETNIANINMSKLESAPDIDPLFRKMSKAFDEGGAKGLLLNNLGVAKDGCRIEFDSKDDTVADVSSTEISDAFSQNKDASLGGENHTNEGEIDTSALGDVLRGLLAGSSFDSLQLVPQLKTLRADFSELEAAGYVVKDAPKTKAERYGVTEEEEKEAEQCIHREALERSQRSVMNASLMASFGANVSVAEDDGGDDYCANDFSIGDAGFDDNDIDNEFQPSNNSHATLSTGSQVVSFTGTQQTETYPTFSSNTRASTTMLLDALCSSDAFAYGGDYEYFSQAALEKVSAGNLWAGSAHWKKTEKIRHKKAKQFVEPQKERKKRSTKERSLLDFSISSFPCLDTLSDKGKPRKGRSNPLQITQTMLKKQRNTDNLLPPDAGIDIEHLSRLFMRPNSTLRPPSTDLNKRKSVGFHGVEFNVAFDDGANASFDDEGDHGPAFDGNDDGNFAAMDDFVIEDIEGVRKVEKIQVGYATVAKKVDVKRLKKDLWTEVEAKTKTDSTIIADTNNKSQTIPGPREKNQISFQETVMELESSQSQTEVTVPFYFICILHLANEKGLKLDSTGTGLTDFTISRDDGSAPSVGTLPCESNEPVESLVANRVKRSTKALSYQEGADDNEDEDFLDQ